MSLLATRRSVSWFLTICCLVLIASACRKFYSKEGNVLPEALQSMADTSSCGFCPYYIQRVELKRDTYFMLIPKHEATGSGVICHWITGAFIVDENSIRILESTDLYSRIISQGKKKEILFDCP